MRWHRTRIVARAHSGPGRRCYRTSCTSRRGRKSNRKQGGRSPRKGPDNTAVIAASTGEDRLVFGAFLTHEIAAVWDNGLNPSELESSSSSLAVVAAGPVPAMVPGSSTAVVDNSPQIHPPQGGARTPEPARPIWALHPSSQAARGFRHARFPEHMAIPCSTQVIRCRR